MLALQQSPFMDKLLTVLSHYLACAIITPEIQGVSNSSKWNGEVAMATKDTGSGQQKTTRSTEEVEEQAQDAQASEELKERQEKLSEDTDSVLDEIDDVLEENAEEFVRSFVQKGGQ